MSCCTGTDVWYLYDHILRHFQTKKPELMDIETRKHEILVILPNANDRAKTAKLDPSKYEVHFIHASDELRPVSNVEFCMHRMQFKQCIMRKPI